MREPKLRAEELRADIDRERPVPVINGEVAYEAGILNAGVLAQRIETAEPMRGLIHQCGDARRICDVAPDESDPFAEVCRKPCSPLLIEIAHRHAGAFGQQ